jgi:hypothetical protein
MSWKQGFIALALLASGTSHSAMAQGTAATARGAPEADRRAILAMAGTYKVKFDFREQTVFTPGYTPIDPKISGGREVVRVVEDTGNHIVLQHILVVKDPKDPASKAMVIKHWRQDWTYQPKSVLTYRGASVWADEAVSRADAAGAWSQTVWQTDDSPRYGGVGRWTHVNGTDSWTSSPTWRPLARRDAVRHPVYDRYYGVNRHALTPAGWVHEQRNDKMGMKDGQLVTYVDETVVNTYDKFSDFDVAAADSYWAATKDYWAKVRGAWDAKLAGGKPLTVTEVAETGSVTGEKLMGWADEIAEGKVSAADAEKQAIALIGALGPTRTAAR